MAEIEYESNQLYEGGRIESLIDDSSSDDDVAITEIGNEMKNRLMNAKKLVPSLGGTRKKGRKKNNKAKSKTNDSNDYNNNNNNHNKNKSKQRRSDKEELD